MKETARKNREKEEGKEEEKEVEVVVGKGEAKEVNPSSQPLNKMRRIEAKATTSTSAEASLKHEASLPPTTMCMSEIATLALQAGMNAMVETITKNVTREADCMCFICLFMLALFLLSSASIYHYTISGKIQALNDQLKETLDEVQRLKELNENKDNVASKMLHKVKREKLDCEERLKTVSRMYLNHSFLFLSVSINILLLSIFR